MPRIDPHTHSAYSDSIDLPSQLMVEAVRADLDCVGLSDHDIFAGRDEVGAAISSTGVALIRGMEISCAANGINVYLLALPPDPSDEGLLACIERAHESRAIRALKIVENLSADCPITWGQVLAFTSEEGPIGYPHTVDAPVATEAPDDRSAVFMGVLHPLSPYYVRYWAPNPTEAVQLVLETGGVPVLVHPKVRVCQRLLPESVIKDMKEVGLFGIERDHRDHVPEDHEAVDHIAKRLDPRVFGSSDYRDTGKPNHIGEDLIAPAIIDETVERAHLEALHP